MAFVTEKKLETSLDVPVSLPQTELIQGDWLVLATIRLVAGQRIVYRYLSLELFNSTVDLDDINSANKISANLDLVFVGLYRDYVSGHPGLSPAVDVLKSNQLGLVTRSTPALTLSTAGVYTFIVANNMKSATGVTIPITTLIDFTVCVSGQARLELAV